MINRLKISITGKNPDYFLGELIKRNINIYYVKKSPKQLQTIIDYQDFLIITKLKTTYKIKIIERYGLNKYKNLLKQKIILVIFILIGIFLNIILSNLIFKVEIIHSNKELIKTLEKDLSELGLKKYHFKVSYEEKERIKKEVLNKEKDLLEWIEIEEKGTKYIVKVEQRKKNSPDTKCNPRHIVSKKNALVKEIFASSGEIVKKKNDYVTTGEVLISGLIYNKENIVSKRCSVGKVYGEVWYNVKVSVPKNYSIIEKTNQKNSGISLKFLKKEYNFFTKYQTFEKKVYNIVESKIIPINFGFAEYTKTKENIKKYTTKNVDDIALKVATKKIIKNLKKDDLILSKKVLKKTEFNSKIEVEVFFKIKENITDYLDITDINIEEINEEAAKKEE